MKKLFADYVKLTYALSFQTWFKKVAQHTGGKLLVNSTKHRKENRLHSLEQWNKLT